MILMLYDIALHTESSSREIHLIPCVLNINQLPDQFIPVLLHTRAEREHHVLIFFRITQTIDAGYGRYDFMLYGMISAIGVRNVVENKVDLTRSRNLIIAGVIFVCGLGFSKGITFTIGETSITLTALAIAAIAGILLNAILPGNDYQFGVNPDGDQSRGVFVKSKE